MFRVKYLIVGSSHAGLSALRAIRVQDSEGKIALLTQEEHLPYSPTILPYVISGSVDSRQVYLWDKADLDRNRITFKQGAKVVSLDSAAHTASLESGESLKFERLLLATGAKPILPEIPGLKEASHHVLRSLEDSLRLRNAAQMGKSAVVLGAGLIGMHAAENLHKVGMRVTVVEALPQVLPGYFDQCAAGLIKKVLTETGINILTESNVTHIADHSGHCTVSLESGLELTANLLLIATGVRPRLECVAGSGVETDEGILVDDMMRTSASCIWAAGDVAQASSFFGSKKQVNATLPNAVEQGTIAGMDMAGDPATKPFSGGLSMNTYRFLGNRAFSVGLSVVPESGNGFEVDQVFLPTSLQYQKLVFQDDRLVGASGINSDIDPGIMWQIIRRRLNLGGAKSRLAASPAQYGRILMSNVWR